MANINITQENLDSVISAINNRSKTTYVDTELAKKINNTEKGSANGVATLDSNGKVVLTQIPDSVLGQLQYIGVWDFTTIPTATEKGQYWVASVSGNGYVVGDWAVWNGTSFDKVDNTDAVSTVAGRTGNVVLTKTDVGLSNVDNTADGSKNVLSSTKLTTARTITIGSTGKSFDGSANVSWSLSEIGAQAADADLTAIAALSGTNGLLKKTAADTWTLDTNVYVTSSGVTSVSGTAPIISSGGNTPSISINAATTSSPGSMSAADKTKLDGIAVSANNYTHPSGDGNLHVPATGTTNNGKVLTAGATAGSLSWTVIPSGNSMSIVSKASQTLPYDLQDGFISNEYISAEESTYLTIKPSTDTVGATQLIFVQGAFNGGVPGVYLRSSSNPGGSAQNSWGTKYEVLHKGKMGENSGIDADKIHGVSGSRVTKYGNTVNISGEVIINTSIDESGNIYTAGSSIGNTISGNKNFTGNITASSLTISGTGTITTRASSVAADLTALGIGTTNPVHIPHINIGTTYGYIPMMSTRVQSSGGFVNNNSIGSYRPGIDWTNSGVYIATGGSDSAPTEAFLFQNGRKISSTGGAISLVGNADSVTNGVYTVGNQTVDGIKTFIKKLQSNGLSTSWGQTNGTDTGSYNAIMGTSASATWLLSGTSGGTFRAGIQALDSDGTLRFYQGGSYFQFANGNLAATSFTGSVVGNASTATALQTARTISMTGDVTYTSGSFNGSANVTGTATLSNSGITAGTYTKLTVDAKGRATSGAQMTLEDIPDSTFKKSVRCATTANLAATYASNVLTMSAVGVTVIDGITIALNDRILIKDQTNALQNGIYIVSTLGTASVATVFTRAADADVTSELASAIVAVDSGTTNGGRLFDNDLKTTDTLGTTAVTFNLVVDTGFASTVVGSTPGTAAIGTSTNYARADHVHPVQTTVSGNAGTVTNGVYTVGDQSIAGVKTFSNGIVSSGIKSTGNVGFQNDVYVVNSRNPIWSFGNSSAYGISYYQATAGIGGKDAIAFDFGTTTSATAKFYVTSDGNMKISGSINTVGVDTSYSKSSIGETNGAWVGSAKIRVADSATDDELIVTSKNIRFGETASAWNYDLWAGLSYTHSEKKIRIGGARSGAWLNNAGNSNDSYLDIVGMTTDGATINGNPIVHTGNIDTKIGTLAEFTAALG